MTKIIDIYEALPEVFSVIAIHAVYKDMTKRTIERAMRRYEREGTITRLKRGLYARTTANQFSVAMDIYIGYIGFSSAMYIYGLKTELEANIYVCTSKAEKPVSFMNTRITPVNMGTLLYGTRMLNDVVVSTYAKTIFDMLYKPKHANFFDLFRALNQRPLEKTDLYELLGYLRDADISTIRRVGYILDKRTPKWFVEKVRNMSSKRGTSFFFHNTAANFNSKWRIYDDANVIGWSNAV